MSLVKSPARTPARIAASRANAKKSTGPRTPEGKRRVILNALKHGERSRDFLANLLKGGSREDKASYMELHFRLEKILEPATAADKEKMKVLVRELWCTQRLLSRGLNRLRREDPPTNLGSPLESEVRKISVRSGIQVVVPWGRLTLHLCLRRGRGPNRQGTRWPRRGSSRNRPRKRVYWTVRIYRHKAHSAAAWLAEQGADPSLRPAPGDQGNVGQSGEGVKHRKVRGEV